MKIKVSLDEELVLEAQNAGKHKTKKEAFNAALHTCIPANTDILKRPFYKIK